MAKEIPEHKDALGRLITIDSCVAYPEGNHLKIGKVLRLNPKMIRVTGLGHRYNHESNKYPQDTVVLDSSHVTMFMLKLPS